MSTCAQFRTEAKALNAIMSSVTADTCDVEAFSDTDTVEQSLSLDCRSDAVADPGSQHVIPRHSKIASLSWRRLPFRDCGNVSAGKQVPFQFHLKYHMKYLHVLQYGTPDDCFYTGFYNCLYHIRRIWSQRIESILRAARSRLP